jgi:hypothetical protein
VSECDRGASRLRKIWPTRNCLAMGGGGNIFETNVSIVKYGVFQIFLTYSIQSNFTETSDSRLCDVRLTFPCAKAYSALRY